MLKNRFKTARERAGLSQGALGELAGVSQATIHKIETGLTLQPRGLEKYAKILGVSPQWLTYGSNLQTVNNVVNEPNADYLALDVIEESSDRFVDVPVYESHLAAGAGAFTDSDVVITYKPVLKETLDRFQIPHNSATIATVSGDSMESTLQDKDVVLINSSASIPTSGKIYAFDFDGDLRVKRFNKRLDGSWLITSDNPDKNIYRDEVLSAHNIGQLRVIGQVVTIVERNLL